MGLSWEELTPLQEALDAVADHDLKYELAPSGELLLPRLIRAGDTAQRLLTDELYVCRVTYPQWIVLYEVGRLSGGTFGDVARAVGVGPSSLTPIVRRLERGKFLVRIQAYGDGRAYLLRLTKPGVRAVRQGLRCLSLVERRAGVGAQSAGSQELTRVLGQLDDDLRNSRHD